MPPPPLHQLSAIGTASYLAWVASSAIVGVVAAIRVLRQPAENWKHRNWSKLAWVLAIMYVAPILGGYPIPVGAASAIWRTRRRRAPCPPGQIPLAQGSRDWPLPWDNK